MTDTAMSGRRRIAWAVMALTLFSTTTPAADGATSEAGRVPYGHPDFYPSDERPVGFYGDHRGHFPAATPPDFEELGENCVVWRMPQERTGMAAPLVVGEKVFVLGDHWTGGGHALDHCCR